MPETATRNKGTIAASPTKASHAPPKARPKTKTVTIKGKRVRLTHANGKTTVAPAPELEWRMQATAVTALRKMPSYDMADGFTFAGDFNAGRRNATKAKATGLTPGETDLRIYLHGGRTLMLELKAANTPVSADQKKRHALLTALGFSVNVIRAASGDEMARLVCEAVGAAK